MQTAVVLRVPDGSERDSHELARGVLDAGLVLNADAESMALSNEEIVILLGGAQGLRTLARVITTYIASRRTHVNVRIDGEETEVTIDSSMDAKSIEQLLERIADTGNGHGAG